MPHLRQLILDQLQRRNYSQSTTRCYLHTVKGWRADVPTTEKILWQAVNEAAKRAALSPVEKERPSPLP